jgi:hypothetical protein
MAEPPPGEPEAEEIEIPEIEDAEPEPRPITIPERRERTRERIAYILVFIFGFEVVAAMLALLFCGADLRGLKDLLTLILTPTVALAGSVIGFYFATADRSKNGSNEAS